MSAKLFIEEPVKFMQKCLILAVLVKVRTVQFSYEIRFEF